MVIKMLYEIGRIVSFHGLKGEVVIKSLTDFDRFFPEAKVFIKDNLEKELIIKTIKKSNKGLIVSFHGLDSISAVTHLKGLYLYTNEKPPLKENEYHYQDIIGKSVYNQNQKFIGVVSEIMRVPQGHIIRVKKEEKEALIPFNDKFIIKVNKNIIVNEIEGLI